MTTALAWIRSSQGSDDDLGLEDQRELVPELAHEVADAVEMFDLGIHSGFSTMTRDDDSGLLDQNPDVREVVDRVREGEFDVIVALDDRRICRDEYLNVIEYAAKQGGAEFAFVLDVPEDDMAYDIRQRVERETKEEEIRKAKRAVQRRQEQGLWQGPPPFGFTFEESGRYLVKNDDFEVAQEVIMLKETHDRSYSEIEDDLGVSTSTAWRIVNERREMYESPETHSAVRVSGE